MTSELCNLKYYIRIFLEIQNFMEVREEHMDVQEETMLKLVLLPMNP